MKFTILQKVIETVYFSTLNHSNTLKENEIHNINHCKYIDRAKATQSKLNHYLYQQNSIFFFSISNIQKSSVTLLFKSTNIYTLQTHTLYGSKNITTK